MSLSVATMYTVTMVFDIKSEGSNHIRSALHDYMFSIQNKVTGNKKLLKTCNIINVLVFRYDNDFNGNRIII